MFLSVSRSTVSYFNTCSWISLFPKTSDKTVPHLKNFVIMQLVTVDDTICHIYAVPQIIYIYAVLDTSVLTSSRVSVLRNTFCKCIFSVYFFQATRF